MGSEKSDSKERKCSHCNDSGMVERYNKDGDVTSTPCPKCKDVMSHIRNWDWKGQMFDG